MGKSACKVLFSCSKKSACFDSCSKRFSHFIKLASWSVKRLLSAGSDRDSKAWSKSMDSVCADFMRRLRPSVSVLQAEISNSTAAINRFCLAWSLVTSRSKARDLKTRLNTFFSYILNLFAAATSLAHQQWFGTVPSALCLKVKVSAIFKIYWLNRLQASWTVPSSLQGAYSRFCLILNLRVFSVRISRYECFCI